MAKGVSRTPKDAQAELPNSQRLGEATGPAASSATPELEAIFDEHYCDEWNHGSSYTSADSLRAAIAKAYALGQTRIVSADRYAPTFEMYRFAIDWLQHRAHMSPPPDVHERGYGVQWVYENGEKMAKEIVRLYEQISLVSSTTESFVANRTICTAEAAGMPPYSAAPSPIDAEALRLAHEFLADEDEREAAILAVAHQVGPKTAAALREAVIVSRELVRIASASTRASHHRRVRRRD